MMLFVISKKYLKINTYRHSVMHYGRQLVVDIKLVYFPCPILLEPYTHARSHVGVYDVNVVISIWELMLVNKTDGMTNFVQIQSFL